jgi:hypothetical protein
MRLIKLIKIYSNLYILKATVISYNIITRTASGSWSAIAIMQ